MSGQCNVVHPFDGMLRGHEKERSTHTRCYVDEPRKHDAEGKKPGTKGHRVRDSVYMKCLGQGHP